MLLKGIYRFPCLIRKLDNGGSDMSSAAYGLRKLIKNLPTLTYVACEVVHLTFCMKFITSVPLTTMSLDRHLASSHRANGSKKYR